MSSPRDYLRDVTHDVGLAGVLPAGAHVCCCSRSVRSMLCKLDSLLSVLLAPCNCFAGFKLCGRVQCFSLRRFVDGCRMKGQF